MAQPPATSTVPPPTQPLGSTSRSGPPLKSILKKKSTARVEKRVHFDSVNLERVAIFDDSDSSDTMGRIVSQSTPKPPLLPSSSPEKQPLRRSARIAARNKRNRPLRRSARIAALPKVNYAV